MSNAFRGILALNVFFGENQFPNSVGESYRVFKQKEEKAFGEYRTRRLVLEAWEIMNG